ncbi:putative sucrase-isomaltase [Rhizodiscina lignyota]|uniref:alpha-glucosidase n=1 Tax=Rhizodiscina lignyota TaxID=1504668 RepID=A0A9P4IG04_9PEZI|nr:putative sucrase-isomaltase [Rhizodiscina lignyota]
MHILIIFLTVTLASLAVSGSIDSCPGYVAGITGKSATSLTANLTLAGDACNVYGDDIRDLQLLVEYQSGNRLHVKIYDAAEQVYQIPETFLSLPSGADAPSDFPLVFSYVARPFSFAIQRRDTRETIFNTTGTNLVFESQYIRLRTSLPEDPYIYGLGEDSDPLRRPTQNYSRTFWNVGDSFLPEGSNLYGAHPIYIEMRDGKAHGVFLGNSDGMDVKINNTEDDGQYLEYNAIGGVFDMYFLAGPTPSEVSQQYAGIVGLPAEVAYWTYGFHQCKYGWQDAMELAEVVLNYSRANIPLETLWTDIDYMDRRRTWTLDPERFPLHKIQELVTYLHDHNQSYIMMVDPPVSLNDSKSYDNGLKYDVFIKHANGTIFVAAMWPGASSWVDWLHPNAQRFWTGEVMSFFNPKSGIDLDGIWIDMNDPANFCPYPCADPVGWSAANGDPPAAPPVRTIWPPLPGFPEDFQPPDSSTTVELSKREITGNKTGLTGRNLLNPPYHINNTDGPLYANTIWPDLSLHGGYSEYDMHNLFASGMITATRSALVTRRPGVRPFIISRSTFAGSGNKTGHWTGDNASLWEHYRISIKQNMEFASFYQIPTVGADVCGFNLNTTETLCARWAVLGAFYPFYRNHADITANQQEFYLWPVVAAAARSAIQTRMQLMDYFYTEFHYQTVDGIPRTILPLFYVYPLDNKTLEISLQFFYGQSLMVSPVTEENATSVTFYLPKDTFYDLFTGEKVEGEGEFITRDNVSYAEIPVHVRGGSIVPMRVDGANNTKLLRELDFALLIAPDAHGNATGRLYLDDGESLNPTETSEISFTYSTATGKLVIGGSFGYTTSSKIVGATVLGESAGKSSSSKERRSGNVVKLDRPLSEAFTATL